MPRFFIDENFNQLIVRGLLRRDPRIDLVLAGDVGLRSTPDPIILEWAARHDRIVLSHDLSTMTLYAYERVRAGEGMPGLFGVPESLAIGLAIEDLLLIAGASQEDEWEGQIIYLPLR